METTWIKSPARRNILNAEAINQSILEGPGPGVEPFLNTEIYDYLPVNP